MSAGELQLWPLGPPPPGGPERPPGRVTGRCAATPRLLADWHESRRGGGPHYAQDIMAPRGTPVLSPVRGRVARSSTTTGPQPSGGHGLSIVTPRATRVTLLHFDGPPTVAAGATVEVGQPLGRVGNSGARASTTCPHLHIEMVANGEPVNIYQRLVELQEMARSREQESSRAARDAIANMLTRAQMYWDAMRARMTLQERETFQREVVNAFRVAHQIAQRADPASMRDAMGRAVAATQAWDRMNRELQSLTRIATSPLTAAQSEATLLAQRTAAAAEELRASLPSLSAVAASGAAGLVIAAAAGLWLLSKVASAR